MVMLMPSWYSTLLLYSVQTFKNKKACLILCMHACSVFMNHVEGNLTVTRHLQITTI